jgi:hypothetical protein
VDRVPYRPGDRSMGSVRPWHRAGLQGRLVASSGWRSPGGTRDGLRPSVPVRRVDTGVMLRSLLVLPLVFLAACGGGSSAPSTADISDAFRTAGASNVVIVPSSVWQAAFAQGQVQGVPVEGAKAAMAHIDSEVGGTFGQSLFMIQVMDSPEAARALARGAGKTGSSGQSVVVSRVLVNGRLVGWYTGDRSHVAVFSKTFNGL